mmetsp:Transcript_10932/g.44044  ORF Transcript_10932/g.44044 Transcript_10932/m.44044 type:complete len:428 (+) Transcript_10932:81-1364(+)
MPQHNISHVWRHTGHRGAEPHALLRLVAVPVAHHVQGQRVSLDGQLNLAIVSLLPVMRPLLPLLLLLLAQPALDDELELEHGALGNVNRRGPRRVLLLVLHLRSGVGVPGAELGDVAAHDDALAKGGFNVDSETNRDHGLHRSRVARVRFALLVALGLRRLLLLGFRGHVGLDGEIAVSIVRDVPDVDVVELLKQGVLLALGERSLGVLLRERRLHLFRLLNEQLGLDLDEPSEDGGALGRGDVIALLHRSRLEVDVPLPRLADVGDVLRLRVARVALAEGVRVLAHGRGGLDVVLVRRALAVRVGDAGRGVGDALGLLVRAHDGGGLGRLRGYRVVVQLGGPRGHVRVVMRLAVAHGLVVHVAAVLLRVNHEGALPFPTRENARIRGAGARGFGAPGDAKNAWSGRAGLESDHGGHRGGRGDQHRR